MKILHTSDLHLGLAWKGQPRLSDQLRVLDEVLALAEQYAVDLILVTGDVFADRVEGALSDVARQLIERLRAPLQRGRAVFLLRGNHDEFRFFHFMDLVVNELAGQDRWPLVVASVPGVYRVPGRTLQVVTLPYMRPSWIEEHAPDFGVTPEERGAGLSAMLGKVVQWLGGQADPQLPAIFAGHLLVRGAQLNPDKDVESGYAQELVLDPKYLPHFTSYNALGHIHLSQALKHTQKPTWYAGGPDRLDLGEHEYQPQVLLVTTPDQPGQTAEVTPIQLTSCTPFVREDLSGLAAVKAFCARIGSADPLGIVTLAGIPFEERRAAEDAIRQAAPRLMVHWAPEATAQSLETAQDSGPDYHDVPATVSAYLAEAFRQQPAQATRLEKAFAALWGAPVEEAGQ